MIKVKNKIPKFFHKRLNWVSLLFIVFFILSIGGYLFIIYGGKLIIDEKAFSLNEKTTIETIDGEVVWEVFEERRTLVSIDDIPEHVQDAFIAIEDRRFYEHAGVDMKSVIRAVYRDIVALGKVEGASTITQQLAKNLFLENDKSWMRKTKEVMAAIYLERKFTKKDILELYLNKIYFGHGVHGIEEASNYFFSKTVRDLNIAEGALLAGLVKGPNGYSPVNDPKKAMERRNVVLASMNKSEMISSDISTKEQRKDLGLNISEKEYHPSFASYVDLVLKEAAEKHQLSMEELKRGGYQIIVHLDPVIQKIAYDEFKSDDFFPGSMEGVEGSFVMMDQQSRGIVSSIGGREFDLGDLNRTLIKRQPGSTIKPLAVYGPALMMEKYNLYSLIRDEGLTYDGYTVSNYDQRYSGSTTLYESILESKNASTVWLFNDIGINYAKEYLNKMNLTLEDEGLAIALGGLSEGISPLNMMGAYGTFAQQGVYAEPYAIYRINNRNNKLLEEDNPVTTNVFNSQVAWDMTEVLTATVEKGTAQSGTYTKVLAGKTGSTEHPLAKGKYKDAWFVGYTPEYVSALWMGYDHSDEDHFLTAASEYPTKLTKSILTEIDKRTPLETAFKKPSNVEELPEPIVLPEMLNIRGEYIFGGLSIVKGKLTWESAGDDRVVYRIYQVKDGVDERIGEVVGEKEYIIDDVSMLKTTLYYVVPYNPLTKTEGQASDIVELSL